MGYMEDDMTFLFIIVWGVLLFVILENLPFWMFYVWIAIPFVATAIIIIKCIKHSDRTIDFSNDKLEQKHFVDKYAEKCENTQIRHEIDTAKSNPFNKKPYPIYLTKNYIIAKTNRFETRAISLKRIVWAYIKNKGTIFTHRYLVLKLDTNETIKIKQLADIVQCCIIEDITCIKKQAPWINICTRPSTKHRMRWHFKEEVAKKDQAYNVYIDKYDGIY